MKVGILSFIHTKNFGANLQCFALQESIKNIGKDVDVINLYRPCDAGYIPCKNDKRQFPSLFSYKSIKDYRSKFNKCIARVLNLFRKEKSQREKSGFLIFQEKYINFSQIEYRNITSLYENFPSEAYSHVIVGSDQVWNYAANFSKEPFFLTFYNGPQKISYAASVGHDVIPYSVGKKYSKWLADFSAISVREDTAVTAISKLTDHEVVRTLDPTLLLTKNDWINSFALNADEEKDIVLVYMLSVSTEVLMLAQNIARKLNCSVKIITSRPYFKTLDNCEFLRSENPQSFIELYNRAKFVVTNSFHGTAFAINFNIPFVTIDKKGARLNSRKSSLMRLLNLDSRNLFEGEDYDVEDILRCDFTQANLVLYQERQRSLDFLKASLK